jgi:hypothetical protein
MKKRKSENPPKIFTLDTETRGLFGDVFRVGFYTGEKYYSTNSVKQLIPIIQNYAKKYDCHIFVHNLDFDLAKMAMEVVPKADLKNSIFINNNVTIFQTSLIQGQIHEEQELKPCPVVFHDSLKLIPGSLSDICKDFKIEVGKAKIDLTEHILQLGWGLDDNGNPTNDPEKYNKSLSEGYYFEHVDPYEKELNEYLKNDCISLYEVVKTLWELSGLPLEEFLKCPTTASLAMKVYQVNYPDDYEKAISTKYKGKWGDFLEKFIREGYYGGRTEVFTPELYGGYHYDVNSLYPYVMKTHKIPIGYPKHFSDEQAETVFEAWRMFGQGTGFLECDIYIPEDLFIPPLPRKDQEGKQQFKKLIFPVGNVHGVWTFEELDLALEMGGEIKKYYQCVFFEKTDYIFRDFVLYFEKIKKNSDGAKRQFAKLMQNSLYGKFGMHRIRETMLPVEMIEKCEEKGYPYAYKSHPFIEGEQFIVAQIPSHAEYIQPHIAAYITSMARIVLYQGLMAQLKKGAVNYCDTDSIACEAEMDPDMIDDKEYGKWKKESEILEGIFIQPKVYYEKHKEFLKDKEGNIVHDENGNALHKETLRFKGVPKKYMKTHVNRGVYVELLERLKDLQRRIENGEKITKKMKEEAVYTIYQNDKRRIKFGTAIKHGIDDFDREQELKKRILLLNMQKRQMDYLRNTSRPHVVKDF